MNPSFKSSAFAKRHYSGRPDAMADIGFQLVNLLAAIESGAVTDPKAICDAAADIDSRLEAWAAQAPSSWRYVTVDVDGGSTGEYFDGKLHVYEDAVGAQMWNSWRGHRILINQVLFRHGDDDDLCSSSTTTTTTTSTAHLQDLPCSSTPDGAATATAGVRSAALAVIRRLSTDVCISSACLVGTPRE